VLPGVGGISAPPLAGRASAPSATVSGVFLLIEHFRKLSHSFSYGNELSLYRSGRYRCAAC